MFKRVMTFALLMSTVFAAAALSQTTTDNSNKVVVDRSILTADQLRQVQTSQTLDQVAQIGQYAGLGKEIGEGVNGALSAITDNANKFANTKVGVYTMWLVAYKVVGGRALRFVVGGIMLLLMFPTLVWAFRRNAIVRPILSKEIFDPTTKARTREFRTYEPNSYRQWGYGIVSILFILILILITCA